MRRTTFDLLSIVKRGAIDLVESCEGNLNFREVEARAPDRLDKVRSQAIDGRKLDCFHAERDGGVDIDSLVIDEERLIGSRAELCSV